VRWPVDRSHFTFVSLLTTAYCTGAILSCSSVLCLVLFHSRLLSAPAVELDANASVPFWVGQCAEAIRTPDLLPAKPCPLSDRFRSPLRVSCLYFLLTGSPDLYLLCP